MDEDEKLEFNSAVKALQDAATAIATKANVETTAPVNTLSDKGVGELVAKQEKAQDQLDKFEEKNQAKVQSLVDDRKADAERIEKMEAKIARLAELKDGGDSPGKKEEVSALRKYINNPLEATDKKYMRSDDNAAGGFLMGTTYQQEIVPIINDLSDVRSVARVKKQNHLKYGFIFEESEPVFYWTGEKEAFTESNPTFGAGQIHLHGGIVKSSVTNTASLGSDTDLEAYLKEKFSVAKIKGEGPALTNGNGVKKPFGFMFDPVTLGKNVHITAASGVLDSDDLIDFQAELKAAVKNPMFHFNRYTLRDLRKMRYASDGHYVWGEGNYQAGEPNTILGDPYKLIHDMPAPTAGLYPIFFGDMYSFYTVIDSTVAIFLRNPYKEEGCVILSMETWTGGDMVQKDAGVLLQVKS